MGLPMHLEIPVTALRVKVIPYGHGLADPADWADALGVTTIRVNVTAANRMFLFFIFFFQDSRKSWVVKLRIRCKTYQLTQLSHMGP